MAAGIRLALVNVDRSCTIRTIRSDSDICIIWGFILHSTAAHAGVPQSVAGCDPSLMSLSTVLRMQ